MALRSKIQHEISQGYEILPMQIKNKKVVVTMMTPIMVIHNTNRYSPIPRTPAGMKQ